MARGRGMTIGVDELEGAISDLVEFVGNEDAKALAGNCRAACQEASQYLHANSPRDTGRYASNWRYKVETKGAGDGIQVRGVVYNAGETYRLTHLLEDGHEQFFMGHDTGHRYPGKPHIAPAFEAARPTFLGGA